MFEAEGWHECASSWSGATMKRDNGLTTRITYIAERLKIRVLNKRIEQMTFEVPAIALDSTVCAKAINAIILELVKIKNYDNQGPFPKL